MPPVSPPMMINVKQCMVREIFFVFQWWRQKNWEPLVYRRVLGTKEICRRQLRASLVSVWAVARISNLL
jgi:hypothetical protein